MRSRPLLPLAAALLLTACPAAHRSPPARASEAASELNLNTRFGRMEMAAQHVDAKARPLFFTHRQGWGGRLRIVDYELGGLRMASDQDAEVWVKVAWQPIDSGDLRTTTIFQKWHDFDGDFRLVEEKRDSGDLGLFGEPDPRSKKPHREPAYYPTIRLGSATD